MNASGFVPFPTSRAGDHAAAPTSPSFVTIRFSSPIPAIVIPAQAGIHFDFVVALGRREQSKGKMDPCFRRDDDLNDPCFRRDDD
ncbi:hypothetical protein ACFPN1_11060 [Lysobacter yangpyeongensis]|uniref:Uncharacterized protein n=1 Tax=Lysobacter yangpyeongensis TaxID=346182 RepID=A0ABW0SNA4_9GAMM